MNRWKIGSLTAALGCVALGVILVAAQFGSIGYGALAYLWPILIILFGVEMLARVIFRSEGKTRISFWSILLIVLLAAGSGVQTLFSGVSIGGWSVTGWNTLAGSISGSVDVGADIKKVEIHVTDAKVTAEGTDGGKVNYDGRLRAPGASTQEEADRITQENWKVTTEQDTVILSQNDVKEGWLSDWSIGWSEDTYLKVTLPKQVEVEVYTSNGAVEVFNVDQSVVADTSNGKLNLRDIGGSVTAESNNGSIRLENIGGEAKVGSSNGSLTLTNIGGALQAKSSNGKIIADSAVGGNWNLRTSNGKVEMMLRDNPDVKLTAETSNGSIKGNVNWTLDGEDDGTAQLGSGKYTIEVHTTNGSVTANQ
ncbi:DUF4097 family beta strand repeat-containing protein [Paenibacillus sp. CN-4]|uniref:DUF4097 family beta strand repeat-containing protein n=1 Tax=Paenibacillus nanchangensis TaxID=3348343 RepID=UPI00397CE130